jgi:hypothetical protein
VCYMCVCPCPCAVQVGISFVGLSSVLSGEGSSTHKVSTEEMLMGMGLIVASQVCRGGQMDSSVQNLGRDGELT